jgi:hypothetical protein
MIYNASSPGLLTIGGQTFFSKTGFKIDKGLGLFDGGNDVTGKHDLINAITHTITFVPDGQVTAGRLALLFAAVNKAQGAFIWDDDGGCVIHTQDGRKVTYAKAWIVPNFSMNISTQRQAWNTITIMCVKPDAATAIRTITSDTYPGHSGYNFAKAYGRLLTATYGDEPTTPWDTFFAQNGVELRMRADLKNYEDDSVGLANQTLTNITFEATFTPVGPTVAQVCDRMSHEDRVLGGPLANPEPLYLYCNDLFIQLTNAVIVEASESMSASDQTMQPITFRAQPVLSSGLLTPRLVINDN